MSQASHYLKWGYAAMIYGMNSIQSCDLWRDCCSHLWTIVTLWKPLLTPTQGPTSDTVYLYTYIPPYTKQLTMILPLEIRAKQTSAIFSCRCIKSCRYELNPLTQDVCNSYPSSSPAVGLPTVPDFCYSPVSLLPSMNTRGAFVSSYPG